MSNSNLDRLMAAGFGHMGTWRQSADGDAIFIHEKVPNQPGVYIFVVQNKIMYVGSAAKSMRSRMRNYKRHQRNNSETRLVHREIKKIHNNKSEIEVYTLTTDPYKLDWNGLPIDLMLGLEAGLIEAFHPEWNHRGKKPVRKKIEEAI